MTNNCYFSCMILVTGATGLVGSHLLYKLASNNERIRAIYRKSHKLEMVKNVFAYYTDKVDDLYGKIEWFEADLNDLPALEMAFQDVDHVYHCAAFVSFEPDRYRQLRKINIEGTANIVNLCVAHRVKKLCYVSSVATLGSELDESKSINEETAWNAEEDHNVYAITKYGAEIEVWRGTQEGVDAVLVNPGVILGPGFWKNGGSGSLFYKIYKGFPYYTSGTTGYVDVLDVTEAMIALMESSIKNDSFVVVGENLTFKDFFYKMAKALGVRPPHKKASPLLLQIGWRLDWLRHKLLGKRRILSKQMAKTVNSQSKYSSEKLKSRLGFKFRDIDGTIVSASNHFLNDLTKPKKQ